MSQGSQEIFFSDQAFDVDVDEIVVVVVVDEISVSHAH